MCIDSVSVGSVLLPSKSTSRTIGKGVGSYKRKLIILPTCTYLGFLDILGACSIGPNLHLYTFIFIDNITSIQLTLAEVLGVKLE